MGIPSSQRNRSIESALADAKLLSRSQVDGTLDADTTRAIKAYQTSRGWRATGSFTEQQVAQLVGRKSDGFIDGALGSPSSTALTGVAPAASGTVAAAAAAPAAAFEIPADVKAVFTGTGDNMSIPEGLQPTADAGAKAARDLGFGGTIGGVGERPNVSDHPVGLAIDLMTSDLKVGDTLSDFYIRNGEALGVKYVIWNRQIAEAPDFQWSAYSGASPHTDHVHVSFNGEPGSGVVTAPVAAKSSGQTSGGGGSSGGSGGGRTTTGGGGGGSSGGTSSSASPSRVSSSTPVMDAEAKRRWDLFLAALVEQTEMLLAKLEEVSEFQAWLQKQNGGKGAEATPEMKQQFVSEMIAGLDKAQGGSFDLQGLAGQLAAQPDQAASLLKPLLDAFLIAAPEVQADGSSEEVSETSEV